MFPPCRSWFGRFSCISISGCPIHYVNSFTMKTQNNDTLRVTLQVSQASPSSTHSVRCSQIYFSFHRNKHHFSSFTALNLCSALLCLVFFFFILPLHSLHALVWKCAWPIRCDGNVREWLLRAGVFVCWLVLPTYYLLSLPWQCVSQSAPGAWWSVANKVSCHLNKKLYSFFWSDHCNHLNKSPQECCQLSDSVHSRLITSRTLCAWKSTQPNNGCVTPWKNMNSYSEIKCLLNALFFIVRGWESHVRVRAGLEDCLAHLFVHCRTNI